MKVNRIVITTGVVLAVSLGLVAACCPVDPEGPEGPEPPAVPQEEATAEPTEESVASTEAPTNLPEPTAEPSPLESPLESPIESPAPFDGQAMLQERCTVCHDLVRVTGATKNRAEWEQTVDRMISKGARLNEEEHTSLINYLAETYGP
jgi:cytochrome c5